MLNFPNFFVFAFRASYFSSSRNEKEIFTNRRGGMYYFKFQMLCTLFRNDELNSDLHKLLFTFFKKLNSTIHIALTTKIISEKK